MECIRTEFSLYLSDSKNLLEALDEQVEIKKSEKQKEIRHYKDRENRIRMELNEIYMDYRSDKLDPESYLEKKQEKTALLEKTIKQISDLGKNCSAIDKDAKKCRRMLRSLLSIKDDGALTKEAVSALIRRIEVYPKKRIEIQFDYMPTIGGE